jgi:TonB family protein
MRFQSNERTLKLVLAAIGLWAFLTSPDGFSQEPARQLQAGKAGQFNGRWTNVNPSQATLADAITRIEIHSGEQRLFVRMWTRCRPLDCEMGEESTELADAEDGTFTLVWAGETMGATQKFSLVHDDLLRVEGKTRWSDPRRPELSYNLMFARSATPTLPVGMASVPGAIQRGAHSVASLLTVSPDGKETNAGSGFFLQPDLLATSYSVIKGKSKLLARVPGNSTPYQVTEIVEYDEDKDVAVVRVPGAKAWPLTLGRSVAVVGIDVFVVRNSGGTEPTVSRGIVSTIYPTAATTQVEITASASPGDTGSAVLNKRGEVIGLLTSVGEGKRVSLATPASELLPLLRHVLVQSPDGTTRPVMIDRPKPSYTEKARDKKTQGEVVMRVLVGADGLVKQVEVIRGLPDGLTEEALKSMYKTRFRPATRNGQPIELWITAEASFYLR